MLKTLRLYPRLSYVFSIILHLNTYFYSSISDQYSGVYAGAMGAKRAALGSNFGAEGGSCIRMAGTSRRPHVVTSPRRDVPTSRRWVNQYKIQQSATSRRRVVSASSVFSSLKAKRGAKFEVLGIVRTKARKSEQAVTSISKKSP